MESDLKRLKEILARIKDLLYTQAILDWDQQTNMPEGGAADRAEQLATLAEITHQLSTSDEIGSLLEKLNQQKNQIAPASEEACLIRVATRQYQKSARVPPEWVVENARVTALAHTAWEKSKKLANFEVFKPHLERIVELRKEYSSFFSPYTHIYDPQLDDFEPGLLTKDVLDIFTGLKREQVALIQDLASRPQVDAAFLHLHFPEKSQWDFGVEVMSRMGFDWNRGRQDHSVHPFTSSLGFGDVRVTTRIDENSLPVGLFGSIHECGHALYEQGFAPGLARTPLADGASMAFHESQSRMWENIIGRSRPFWAYFYPKLQRVFPSQLEGIPLDTFYRGINQVQPSAIRTEADEATYNLHIMVRLELEIALLEGSLEVKSLPDAWNDRMKTYLGVVPRDDAEGVLQDVHWSFGGFGYFPTYALGNLIAAQLWEKIQADIPEVEGEIADGRFGALLSWLRINIHQYGAMFEPQVLIEKITGSKINSGPYLKYLGRKYSEIYGL